MQLEQFLQIYKDLLDRNRLNDTEYFYLHCNLYGSTGLTRIKVNIASFTFVQGDDASPISVVRFVPTEQGIGNMSIKTGCDMYMPIEQIVCVSEDTRADGFTAKDMIAKNTELLNAFNEKQRRLLEGASAEELAQIETSTPQSQSTEPNNDTSTGADNQPATPENTQDPETSDTPPETPEEPVYDEPDDIDSDDDDDGGDEPDYEDYPDEGDDAPI